ncbi:uncharacterized protein LOC113314278 [Papaver somniferum]|uniref:uncharacterized protein LOC113314278 n=1 Tax=Papaver somniferum TaxID=3469 RepID=UPI000E6FBA7C|nr:uncharacterized protein LOC113314278 [Papaver somniferum]
MLAAKVMKKETYKNRGKKYHNWFSGLGCLIWNNCNHIEFSIIRPSNSCEGGNRVGAAIVFWDEHAKLSGALQTLAADTTDDCSMHKDEPYWGTPMGGFASVGGA